MTQSQVRVEIDVCVECGAKAQEGLCKRCDSSIMDHEEYVAWLNHIEQWQASRRRVESDIEIVDDEVDNTMPVEPIVLMRGAIKSVWTVAQIAEDSDELATIVDLTHEMSQRCAELHGQMCGLWFDRMNAEGEQA